MINDCPALPPTSDGVQCGMTLEQIAAETIDVVERGHYFIRCHVDVQAVTSADAPLVQDHLVHPVHLNWKPQITLVFRDEGDKHFLDQPWPLTVITAAAPNRGAMIQARQNTASIPATIERRATRILEIAASQRQDTLILGAWGCGVFANDIEVVAGAFRAAIDRLGIYFQNIHFAILDNLIVIDQFMDQLRGGRHGLNVRYLESSLEEI